MYNSLAIFRANIASVRELASLHEYLQTHLKSPMVFDDLLRFQIAYAVSALDKLVHDLIRIGMLQTFMGNRPPTSKYLAEKISMSAYGALSVATIPPKEYYFEQEIIGKLRTIAYQSPENIADGLSYIWDEKFKWQKLAAAMLVSEDVARTQLRLIVDRRNKIVHEADIDIATGGRFSITAGDCHTSVAFIEKCGKEIFKLVV